MPRPLPRRTKARRRVHGINIKAQMSPPPGSHPESLRYWIYGRHYSRWSHRPLELGGRGDSSWAGRSCSRGPRSMVLPPVPMLCSGKPSCGCSHNLNHTLDCFKPRKLHAHSPGGQKSIISITGTKSRCRQGLASSGSSGGDSVPVPSSFCWLLAFRGSGLCPSGHMAIPLPSGLPWPPS